jgi:cytochrome P450
MAEVMELNLPELDFFDVGLKGERFHRSMDELSRAGWLARSPVGYFVLDRESAAFFLRTKAATFPGMKIAEMFDVPEGPLLEQMRRNILHINGDDHRRLRNLVNPAFTPRAADRWRPAMRDFLERLWEPLSRSGCCEFVEVFAKPYPSLTIATVMGAPLDDAPKLHEWSNLIQRQFDGPSLLHERDSIERACEEFYEWAGALIERR